MSLTRSLDAIEEELNNLGDIAEFINISTLMSWEQLIQAAFELFLLNNSINILYNIQYEKITADETGLLLFLQVVREYKPKNTNNSIRGPDAFALDFYRQLGGADQLALFLFGKASQHRY